MGFLAFGLFLIVVGVGVLLAPTGPLSSALDAAGWACVALGAILAVVHVATGPRRVPADRTSR